MARLILKKGKSVKDLGRTIHELSKDKENEELEKKLRGFFKTVGVDDRGKECKIKIKIIYDTDCLVHVVIPHYGDADDSLEDAGAESAGLISISGCGK